MLEEEKSNNKWLEKSSRMKKDIGQNEQRNCIVRRDNSSTNLKIM